jgi:predicted TIM-barrel fold metal-dependent hydrolase
VYLEISSIPPQNLLNYFPDLERLADKVLWGSDWPGPMVPGMKANVERFLPLPLSDAAKQRILYDNAARLFRL